MRVRWFMAGIVLAVVGEQVREYGVWRLVVVVVGAAAFAIAVRLDSESKRRAAEGR